MLRAEIISNQSVQDNIIELLEQELPELEYTIIPEVNGTGKTSQKLGDVVWPEMNFILFTYVTEENAKKIKAIFNAVKQKFPREGISLFFTQCVEI